MGTRISVATGQFEDLLAIGLRTLLREEDSVELVAHDVSMPDMDDVLSRTHPTVMVLNFGALPSIATVRLLLDEHPGTRFVVMANRPTTSEANQMLAFGAT